jgi:hypothetical protein
MGKYLAQREVRPRHGGQARPAGLHPGESLAAASKNNKSPKSCAVRGANLHAIDDSSKGYDMTPIEFREKKTHEIQELLEKLSSLDGTSFSSENKDRLFHTYQRQIERLTVIVSSPSLERLCSG